MSDIKKYYTNRTEEINAKHDEVLEQFKKFENRLNNNLKTFEKTLTSAVAALERNKVYYEEAKKAIKECEDGINEFNDNYSEPIKKNAYRYRDLFYSIINETIDKKTKAEFLSKFDEYDYDDEYTNLKVFKAYSYGEYLLLEFKTKIHARTRYICDIHYHAECEAEDLHRISYYAPKKISMIIHSEITKEDNSISTARKMLINNSHKYECVEDYIKHYNIYSNKTIDKSMLKAIYGAGYNGFKGFINGDINTIFHSFNHWQEYDSNDNSHTREATEWNPLTLANIRKYYNYEYDMRNAYNNIPLDALYPYFKKFDKFTLSENNYLCAAFVALKHNRLAMLDRPTVVFNAAVTLYFRDMLTKLGVKLDENVYVFADNILSTKRIEGLDMNLFTEKFIDGPLTSMKPFNL